MQAKLFFNSDTLSAQYLTHTSLLERHRSLWIGGEDLVYGLFCEATNFHHWDNVLQNVREPMTAKLRLKKIQKRQSTANPSPYRQNRTVPRVKDLLIAELRSCQAHHVLHSLGTHSLPFPTERHTSIPTPPHTTCHHSSSLRYPPPNVPRFPVTPH